MKYILYILLCFIINGCHSIKQKGATAEITTKISQSAINYKGEGNKKSDNGDELGAIECYTKAIEIDPNYAEAYYNRANGKSRLGDNHGAIEDYTKTIKLIPNFIDLAYFGRGMCNVSLGNISEGMSDYTKAIELNPKNLDAYFNLAYIKSDAGDHTGAIEKYKRGLDVAIKQEPHDIQMISNFSCNLGLELYELKRYGEAIEAYTQGIAHCPDDGELYYGRGLARNQNGDKKGACDDWHKSSQLGCRRADDLLNLCN